MGGSDTSDSSDVEAEGLSKMVYQSGRVPVGPKEEDGAESIRVKIEFDFPFYEPPVVVCCAEGQEDCEYPDCFGCTVVNITEAGCEVNVGRCHLEANGWGQEVILNWCAMLSKDTEICQAGVEEAGPKEEEDPESMEVKIKFKPAFPKESLPVVICTASGDDYPDCFVCTLRRVTRKHAFVRIARTHAEYSTWGQSVKVNWIATQCFPSGRIEVGPKDNEDSEMTMPGIEYPGKYKKKPTVFVVTQHQPESEFPDAFACCAANVQKESFQMNIGRIHKEVKSWGMNLRAHYVVIP